TWTDIGNKITANGYNFTLDNNQSLNPLAGRLAFAGASAGFPADVVTTVDLGTDYASQTVQVRFRAGSDDGGNAIGWFIDDINFTGLTNTPFTAVGPQSSYCAP